MRTHCSKCKTPYRAVREYSDYIEEYQDCDCEVTEVIILPLEKDKENNRRLKYGYNKRG